jgi:hypothetical protein
MRRDRTFVKAIGAKRFKRQRAFSIHDQICQ